MNGIITFFMSIFEWTSLLIFPIVLLGYPFRRYFKSIMIISVIIGLFSYVLHMTSLHILVIIAFQMVTLLLLIKWLFRAKKLEALVITSMGYGFYIFIQMLLLEIIARLFEFEHFQLFFTFNAKTMIQIVGFTFIFTISLAIYYSKYQLDELRHYIIAPSVNKKYQTIIILISFLTFIFSWLIIFSMVVVDSTSKNMLILSIMVFSFIILSFYLILHTQFQRKRIVEARKFFLDQDQQASLLMEKLKKDESTHFQVIVKLAERQAPQLIKEYIKANQLDEGPAQINVQADLTPSIDELLYAFLINKRKLASLFGISIQVSKQIEYDAPTALQQIRCLSIIIDDLIYMLYESSVTVDKTIYFHIEAMNNEGISYTISCSLYIKEQTHTNLQLFDALVQFKQLGAVIQSEWQPVHLTIRTPIK
ncbi:hypothetical protein [Bacillus sp. FSL K6-3431]|uniref:hypothetical protein n=1 Tax=Bacillus sp. FSL K6-3431 TaxID=2921500 RepID=UPI0030F8C4BE